MSTKTQYGNPAPELRLGTIVVDANTENINYYVCILPKCDCVRLPAEGRYFPFLPLLKVASSDFGYVINDNNNLIDLQLNIKAYEINQIHFKPLRRGLSVYASQVSNSWVFKSSDPSFSLRWVAELKTDHAQRIANDFARELSRVGLTESEWLRRCAKKDKHLG